MKSRKSKLWLCLPFALVVFIDAGLTLYGQPNEYWSGNRQCVNEIFPVFAWGLRNGPDTFLVLCLGWIFFFSVLIMLTPSTLSEIISLALVNGHTWGAMTWLVYSIRMNYYLCILYFAFTAVVFVLSDRQYRANQGMDPTESGS